MEQSDELKELTLRYLNARANGDFAFIESHLSQSDGITYLGSGPDEWWTGHDTIVATIKANMARDVGGVTLLAEEPVAYSEGTVGWVAERFKLKLPNGVEMPLMFTAVFRKEEGEWKVVLGHLSAVAPSAEAGKASSTR